MGNTKIEWAEKTWNPITGCSKISLGCNNCYAERMAKRLRGRCGYPADEPFRVALHPERLEEPMRWRKPSMVFVCSMGDLFHDDVPDEFIHRVFATIGQCPQHTFIILTKRPKRMKAFIEDYYAYESPSGDEQGLHIQPNVWLGVTAENQEMADRRIPILLQTPAAVRFVSVEPMLGPVDLTNVQFDKWTRMNVLEGCGITTRPGGMGQMLPNAFCEKLSWIIAGGETGPKARPMHPDWARSLRDQCQEVGVPFFFKQWGEWHPVEDYRDIFPSYNSKEFRVINLAGIDETQKPVTEMTPGVAGVTRIGRKIAGRLLDGCEWNEMPEIEP